MSKSYLAFDTSNYTTSAAVYTDGEIAHSRKLLPVKEGSAGLRQSDAVFTMCLSCPGCLHSSMFRR